jgi:hypothetical protein
MSKYKFLQFELYDKILNYNVLSGLWNPSGFLTKNRPILGELRDFSQG